METRMSKEATTIQRCIGSANTGGNITTNGGGSGGNIIANGGGSGGGN